MSGASTRDRVMDKLSHKLELKSQKCSNKNCRDLVNNRMPFKGSHLFAEWVYPDNEDEAPLYVVYSYGDHWPLYIFEPVEDTWLENVSRYGNSTFKHSSQARPSTPTLPLDNSLMLEIVRYGIETTYKEYT